MVKRKTDDREKSKGQWDYHLPNSAYIVSSWKKRIGLEWTFNNTRNGPYIKNSMYDKGTIRFRKS